MIVANVANSGNDEFYTPDYAIDPIMKYIPEGSRIWCPFDTAESLFVKRFSGGPPECDYIISNPPYSLKGDVLQRLFDIGKPFAMLVGVVGLFESQKRFEMFRDNDFEIMYMNRRVAYFKDYAEQKPSLNPPFSSVYVCHGILPKQIVFEEIKKI